MPCLINQCFTPGVALNQQITHPVARLPRSTSSASSALSWGNSKPDVMGEFKTRCGPCKTKYYQGCSKPLFVGNFFSHKRRRQSYSNGLGSNPILVGSFPKLDLYITAFFWQGDVPWMGKPWRGHRGWIPNKNNQSLSPWMFIPMDVYPHGCWTLNSLMRSFLLVISGPSWGTPSLGTAKQCDTTIFVAWILLFL